MATRPDSNLKEAITAIRTVVTGAVALGRVIKDGSNDGECQPTTDGVDGIGIVIALGPLAGAIGDKVTIAYLAGAGIVPVKVGTGGAVRGKYAKCVADGVTSATPDVATPAAMNVVGFFTQSGSAGDMVGLVPSRSWLTE